MGLLFLSLFNAILGLSVLFPVLGPLGRELGLSDASIGVVASGYALAQLLFAPFWGRQSERVGRKRVLVVGVLGFGLGFALFGTIVLAARAGWVRGPILVALLTLSRFAGGALSSATLPTAQAYAADLSAEGDRAKAMGVIGAAFGLAVIFGPAIGGFLAHTAGLLAPVGFAIAMSLANTLLVLFLLPESPRRPGRPPASLSEVAARAWPLLAVSFIATAASVSMEQTVAFAFQDRLRLTESETPLHVAIGLVVYGIVAVFVQGFVVRRYVIAPRVMMLSGLATVTVGYALLSWAPSMLWLVVALALQGLGQGFVLPGASTALSLAFGADDQGAVSGANTSVQGLGRLMGPLVGPSLYSLGVSLPYLTAAGLSLFAIALLLGTRPSRS